MTCYALNLDGRVCGAEASVLDLVRGFYVCAAHAPKADRINRMNMIEPETEKILHNHVNPVIQQFNVTFGYSFDPLHSYSGTTLLVMAELARLRGHRDLSDALGALAEQKMEVACG